MGFLTLKGGCYFASSVHIADALFLMWTFAFEVAQVNKLWWTSPIDDDPYLTTYLVLLGIYIAVALILGCLIFRGVDTDSPRLIGVTGGGFLVLQTVAFIIALCWWYPIPPIHDPWGLLESARVGRFVVRCLATIAYIVVLGFFVRELRLEERDVFRKP